MNTYISVDLTGTTTSEINLLGGVLVGIITPASIASTNIKISTARAAGETHVNAYDGIGKYGAVGDFNPTIASSKYIPVPPEFTCGMSVAKLILGSSETSKTFIIVVRDIA